MTPILKAMGPLILAMCALARPGHAGSAQAGSAGQGVVPQAEYQLKAQILVEMAAYVTWPGAPRRDQPFVIVVVGASGFGNHLSDYAARHTVQGRPIEVRHWNWPKASGPCDLLFVCQSERAWAAQIMEWCAARDVLTVCESTPLVEAGMMAGLVLEGGRVRILLNREALTGQGFFPNYQLLGHAQLLPSR